MTHPVTLSLHAYERFCERFHPVDFETARAMLLTETVVAAASAGAHRVTLRSLDLVLMISAGVITTVWRHSEFKRGRYAQLRPASRRHKRARRGDA